MIIQIIQTNELKVRSSYDEYTTLKDVEEKYYAQCADNPDKVTKEIRIIHSQT